MSFPSEVNAFLEFVRTAVDNGRLHHIKLFEKRDKRSDLRQMLIKPVELKAGFHLSFTYRHETKDITKNYVPAEAIVHLTQALRDDFKQAEAKTQDGDWHIILQSSKKAKLKKSAPTKAAAPKKTHDHQKKRLISADDNPYLQALGVVTIEGKVKKDKHDKFRQINKYIEIAGDVLAPLVANRHQPLKIADMGAGKGYLTFALYDYLTHVKTIPTELLAVEMRLDLVDKGNKLAQQIGYDALRFVQGYIGDADLPDLDVLIALHACDTATDDAIIRGLQAGAQVMMLAPCCHKQVRKAMSVDKASPISDVTKHGILMERQAEMVTDAMRALILEAYGYQARVFDFIATDHTPKNVMIVATKKSPKAKTQDPDLNVMTRLEAMKRQFGVAQFYLEQALR